MVLLIKQICILTGLQIVFMIGNINGGAFTIGCGIIGITIGGSMNYFNN